MHILDLTSKDEYDQQHRSEDIQSVTILEYSRKFAGVQSDNERLY